MDLDDARVVAVAVTADAGVYPIAVGLDGVGLGRAGLLDLVASPRVLGGGVAEQAPGSTDAPGGRFDGLESLW